MTDLIDTTEMYLRTILELEEEGITPMRARIAERLGVHRNSVPARLVRLRRALGVDIEDAEQRANLWFASHYLTK